MAGRQQKNQYELAFMAAGSGEAATLASEGTEPAVAERSAESPTQNERLMEEVCEAENLRQALKRVRSNKGSPGLDGMSVDELPGHLKEHWPSLRTELLQGTYKPQPVKRVEIEKPDGGTRKLGIPTVLDRFIQQAVLQVLQPRWEGTFSDYSYGFRPGRSAHQAVAQAQRYIAEGYTVVVDIDLEKFFDRVNHDILMSRIARRVTDQRALKLMRAFLNAGVMEHGLVSPTDEGAPQGGPLSPWMSNVLLDELDKELESRGHRFCRYADDCNIYVRSERAGERVMASISQYLRGQLKLRVNEEKSAVGRPRERKFLGFSFTGGVQPRRRIAPKALLRLKERIRELTRRSRGIRLEQMVAEVAEYLRGWIGYFGYCETPTVLRDLDAWIRRKLRCVQWKQWKVMRKRYAELRKQGIGHELAISTAGSSYGPWRLSRSLAMSMALSNTYFARLGLPKLEARRSV
jgi:RNA-directed DNA polymerase